MEEKEGKTLTVKCPKCGAFLAESVSGVRVVCCGLEIIIRDKRAG